METTTATTTAERFEPEHLERCGLSVFAARRDYLPEDPAGALYQDLAEGL